MAPGGTRVPAGTDSDVGPGLASTVRMRFIEVDTGRWRLELGQGLGLELILLFSRSVAFWRFGGELVAEIAVGES